MAQDHINEDMIIHDQHVHSYYSFDSQQAIEEYIQKAISLNQDYFVLTDHMDLNYLSSGRDLDFDIEQERKELDKLQHKFSNIKLLQGIEIGYVKSEVPKINKLLKEHNFDLINFSIHEDGEIDFYYQDEFVKLGTKEVLNRYFDKIIEGLNSGIDFDVLCHLDFGFKTAYLVDKTLKIEMFKDKVIQIMKRIIEMDKCLEINIKVQSFINDEHTEYILNLYKQLGGKNITLSSDAHKAEVFYEGFPHYLSLIKKAGFDHVNYFVNRTRFELKI